MSLDQLKADIKNETMISSEKMECFLHNYNGDDWIDKVLWTKAKYTRILLNNEGDTYELMILCWSPGAGSPIHDHPGSQCIMNILKGEVHEKLYEKPKDGYKGEMKRKENTRYTKNQIARITDDVGVHQVQNKGKEGAVTLHLYYPPILKCNTYDKETSEATSNDLEYDKKPSKKC